MDCCIVFRTNRFLITLQGYCAITRVVLSPMPVLMNAHWSERRELFKTTLAHLLQPFLEVVNGRDVEGLGDNKMKFVSFVFTACAWIVRGCRDLRSEAKLFVKEQLDPVFNVALGVFEEMIANAMITNAIVKFFLRAFECLKGELSMPYILETIQCVTRLGASRVDMQ